MIASLLGTVLALNILVSDPPASSEVEKKWEEAIGRVATSENLGIVFDINLNFAPPVGIELLSGSTFLSFLEGATGRFRSAIDGVHVFSRSAGSGGQPSGNRDERSVNWLRRASDEQIAKLSSEGMTFRELMDTFGADVAAIVMPGGDRNLDILQSPESSRLFVNVWIQVEVPDPKTGKVVTDWITSGPAPGSSDGSEVSSTPPTPTPPTKTFAPPPQDGSYRIEKARLMTAAEFIRGATEAFGIPYAYDRRLGDMPMVIRGNFTRERFEEVVKRIFETVALTPFSAEQRVERQIDAHLSNEAWRQVVKSEFTGGVMPQVANEALSRRMVSGATIVTARPRFQQTFDRLGVSPGQVHVKLKPVLSFTVRTPTPRDGSRDVVVIVR